MAALVASSASAEWEMVYIVSWVAMPTITALVVMLARWKGKKPPPVSEPNPTPPKRESTRTPSEMPKNKVQRKEIIRRVTSCPDFAVVRVMKSSSKCGRQVSYSNLKDRRLQDEIAQLADKLLSQAERRGKWGQKCECEWGQGFECERGGGGCEQMRAYDQSEEGTTQSGRGKPACPSLKAVLATRAAKKAEISTTERSGLGHQRRSETVLEGAVQPPRPYQGVSNKLKVTRQIGRLEYYNQLRSIVPLKSSDECTSKEFSSNLNDWLATSSVVRYWGQERWVSKQPGGKGQTWLWSVSRGGVVESWDSRVGGAPMLCHSLRLGDIDQAKFLTVEGLEVAESAIRVRLAAGGGIVLDKRKLANAISC